MLIVRVLTLILVCTLGQPGMTQAHLIANSYEYLPA